MQLTCPCCHARNSIEAFTQDEACRELFRQCGQLPDGFWRTLTSYLGLFRSDTRALAWDRALKLTTSLLELKADPASMVTAMQLTVEALRFKAGKPLKDHNYLKRVLETVTTAMPSSGLETRDSGTGNSSCESRIPNPGSRSKTNQAITALAEWAGNDWLRQAIGEGLSALVAQNLKKAPAADAITLNADIWFQVLKSKCDIEEIDAPRIRRGFEKLFPKLEEWPAPKMLLEHMPPRPERAKIRHEPNPEEAAAGIEMLRNYRESA